MLVEVIMPRMGQSMEEGRVVRWLKAPGEAVKVGEALAEIETDKAVVELESRLEGTLVGLSVPEGVAVPIGAVIAIVEDGQPENSPSKVEDGKQSEVAQISSKESESPLINPTSVNASPIAKQLATDAGIDITKITGTGPGGRIVKEDVENYIRHIKSQPGSLAKDQRVKSSPLARKLAELYNLSLDVIQGSGPDGTITKQDVEGYWLTHKTSETAPVSRVVNTVELSKNRVTSGQRLLKSKTTIPHFYASVDVEMDRSLELHKFLKSRQQNVSINDLVARATVMALVDFPNLNASLEGNDLILHEDVDLALAVALPSGGLITPVIPGCQRLNLLELSSYSHDLIKRARDNRLKEADLAEGTFTISNLGMYGVCEFTAIINPPHAAILAVGAIRRVAMLDEKGTVIPSNQMRLTLSANHQITDGVEAAGFLSRIKQILEDGFSLLL